MKKGPRLNNERGSESTCLRPEFRTIGKHTLVSSWCYGLRHARIPTCPLSDLTWKAIDGRKIIKEEATVKMEGGVELDLDESDRDAMQWTRRESVGIRTYEIHPSSN